jgi:hypothetical protein
VCQVSLFPAHKVREQTDPFQVGWRKASLVPPDELDQNGVPGGDIFGKCLQGGGVAVDISQKGDYCKYILSRTLHTPFAFLLLQWLSMPKTVRWLDENDKERARNVI